MTLAELKQIYDLPLPELMFRAGEVHRRHHDITDVQRCVLLSIKTGGCSEDCGYCAQSARYSTGLQATPLMPLEEVQQKAREAKSAEPRAFAWVPPGVSRRMGRNSTAFSTWSAPSAISTWRLASRSACSPTTRPSVWRRRA